MRPGARPGFPSDTQLDEHPETPPETQPETQPESQPELDNGTAEPESTSGPDGGNRGLISATALMAAGTMASRLLGFGRFALLAAALGTASSQADTFTIANTIPNMIYILLAGGVLNTVFVPQIVRAMEHDADGGEAYTNRLVTVGLVGLGVVTVLTTLLAPAIMWIYTGKSWKLAENADRFDNLVFLATLCLPQIFFYGVNVLIGQVLNSRGRFGPMAWSPLANNVIAIVVLGIYLVIWTDRDPTAPFSTGQLLLLGLGSTFGIVVQALVLIPFMRRAGFVYRPRFDLRGSGLRHTAALAKWTLGYVIVTQVAVWLVTKLASSATLTSAGGGAGLTVYNNAYLLWILPHSLVTVSLATAMLPAASRRAAVGDLAGAAAETTRAMRLTITAIVPACVAFLCLAFPIVQLLFGNGKNAAQWPLTAWTLAAFAIGLVPFTLQYLCLRGFYALEDTRTPFFLQLLIAGSNMALALALVLPVHRAAWIAPGLALAYALAYGLGFGVSFRLLQRRLPTLNGMELVRHAVRTGLAVLPAGLLAALVCWLFGLWSDGFAVRLLALVIAGLLAIALFLALARLLHLGEVNQIVATVLRRRGNNERTSGSARPPDGNVADRPRPGDSPLVTNRHSGTIDPGEAVTPRHRSGWPTNHLRAEELVGGSELAAVGSPGDSVLPGATVPALGDLADAESSIVTHVGPTGSRRPGAEQASGAEHSMATTHLTITSAGPAGTEAGNDSGPPPPDRAEDHLPPGTVLGRRYRLEELLVSSEPAVTWRAFDQVLSRSVLVHLLPAGDPRAPALLEAARRAAIATDSRFLRVLDAVDQTATTEGTNRIGSYIVCEYAVGQSLQTILTTAPLTGLEAGWVIREVADAMAGVHALGLHHRRINPDSVIITPAGNVKIVGLLIEAVLRPRPVEHDGDAPPDGSSPDPDPAAPDAEATDVYDLGRLLYATLVSRWPGDSAFGLPAAPRGRDGHLGPTDESEPDQRPQLGSDQHRWLTPRQVRHGVSPALDRICDQLLSPHPRHHEPPISSAAELVGELGRVLGSADATTDLERRLRHPAVEAGAAPGVVQTVDPSVPRSAFLDQPSGAVAARSPRSPGTVSQRVGRSPDSPAGVTQVGLGTAGRAPTPRRRPASGPSHPRRWIGLLIVLALIAVLTIAVVAVIRQPGGNRSGQAGPAPSSGAPRPSAGAPITVTAARDFDPKSQGGNGSENPGQTGRAFDGDPKSRWTTLSYYGNPKFGRLKPGVGLVLDLGKVVPVSSLRVQLSGDGTGVQARVPRDQADAPDMKTSKSWRTVSSVDRAGQQASLGFSAPVETRYVLVYLTSLPKEGSSYRGGIFEVEVK